MRRFKFSDEYEDELDLYEDSERLNFKEEDLINYKLIKSAANLKTSQIKSISINSNNRNKVVSYYGNSLEAALVRIKRDLKRNSTFKLAKLSDPLNKSDLLRQKIEFKLEKYSNAIIPLL